MPSEWKPDLLGSGFEQRSIDLGADDEGVVTATLVRYTPPAENLRQRIHRLIAHPPLGDVDVLYVHGWSDYFFQTELAEYWSSLGAQFYALDLRKYGRSLRDGQTPGFISDLAEYDAEIGAALDILTEDTPRSAPPRRLVLLGHSTGGLVLTLWAARHPEAPSALILNSPWLEFQAGAFGRAALTAVAKVHAGIDPRGTQPNVDLGFYTRAQRELGVLPTSPEREIWRPDYGFPTTPAWLAAILGGQQLVNSGKVTAPCPTLVLLSRRSSPAIVWDPAMTSTDSVLVVNDIARAATLIAPEVTIERIEGAIHDVFLSAPVPRATAYAAMGRWMLQGTLSRASTATPLDRGYFV